MTEAADSTVDEPENTSENSEGGEQQPGSPRERSPKRQAGPKKYSAVFGNRVGGDTGIAVANYGAILFGETSRGRSLVTGPVTEHERVQAGTAFCEPGGFDQAKQRLNENRLVLLAGRGAGRSTAGVRLLAEENADPIQELDFNRPCTALTADVLVQGAGYMWHRQPADWARHLAADWLGWVIAQLWERGAWMVIVVDERSLPQEVEPFAVRLTPPEPVKLYTRQLEVGTQGTGQETPDVDPEFLRQAPDGSAPAQVVRVAHAQLRVAVHGENRQQALQELGHSTRRAVDEWFSDNQPIAARAQMIAIAVFEGSPYLEVCEEAFRLERWLKNPENRYIWPHQPPDLFQDTRKVRLDQVRACLPPGKTASGTSTQLVSFTRQDWAAEVLRCVWQEYERIRPSIWRWLGNATSRHDMHLLGAKALGRLIGNGEITDPANEFRMWANSDQPRRREMAAAALAALSEQHSNLESVRDRVYEWSRHRATKAQRTTAVLCYAQVTGGHDPKAALKHLGRIADGGDPDLREVVMQSVVQLAEEPRNKPTVLTALVDWLHEDVSWGRQQVGFVGGLWALGIAQGAARTLRCPKLLAANPTLRELVRNLFGKLIRDTRLRSAIVLGLLDWASAAERDSEMAEGLHELLACLLEPPSDEGAQRLIFEIRLVLHEDGAGFAPLCTAMRTALRRLEK